jgi:hypothetical protein
MGYDLLCLVILAIKIGQLSGNKKLYCGYVREMTIDSEIVSPHAILLFLNISTRTIDGL